MICLEERITKQNGNETVGEKNGLVGIAFWMMMKNNMGVRPKASRKN